MGYGHGRRGVRKPHVSMRMLLVVFAFITATTHALVMSRPTSALSLPLIDTTTSLLDDVLTGGSSTAAKPDNQSAHQSDSDPAQNSTGEPASSNDDAPINTSPVLVPNTQSNDKQSPAAQPVRAKPMKKLVPLTVIMPEDDNDQPRMSSTPLASVISTTAAASVPTYIPSDSSPQTRRLLGIAWYWWGFAGVTMIGFVPLMIRTRKRHSFSVAS